jgi:uncharacterized protein (TIGR04255 family)
MNLPKSISPNPLFVTTIEIRFSTSINRFELFNKMHEKFSTTLPIIEEGKIPHDLKNQNENYKFSPDFIFKNEDFSLSFSTKSIYFENISEYKLWEVYFGFVKSCLSEIFEMKFISEIERCGVRYGSLLNGITNPANVLKSVPVIDIEGVNSVLDNFKAFFNTESGMLYLQMSPNAKIQKEEIVKTGLYIDIDASLTNLIKPNDEVFSIIDSLHLEQKKLFFGLLKEEFIQTLNPKY